jgi:hypothetical protein
MNKQTNEYIKEMKAMYETIVKKHIDKRNLTDLDRHFLKLYKKTIYKGNKNYE